MVMQVFAQDPSQRTSIPVPVQSTGRVSYTQGFGEDYSKDLKTDASAKTVERKVINQVLYEVTSLLAEIQRQGSPSWIGGLEYPKGATVFYNSSTFVSLRSSNTTVPVHGVNWKDISVEKEIVIPPPAVTVPEGSSVPLRLVDEQLHTNDGFQTGGNGTVLTVLSTYHASRTKHCKSRRLEMFVNGSWKTVPWG